mgnify:CR=1 FL=1
MEKKQTNPWLYVPSLYFAEGLPYVIINTASVIMYKNLGVPNAKMAFWTSWLYLPWVIKMLWGPVVDTFGTRRKWVVSAQLLLAACMALAACSLIGANFFYPSLLMFAIGAFVSATHDIACDGYYMLALGNEDQAFFIGIRSTAYRLAMICGSGLLVYLAGKMQETGGHTAAQSWMGVLFIAAAMMAVLGVYHVFVTPRPDGDYAKAESTFKNVWGALKILIGYLFAALAVICVFVWLPSTLLRLLFAVLLVMALIFGYRTFLSGKKTEGGSFNGVFVEYFSQEGVGWILAFILLYRLGEAFLTKMTSPFLLDAVGNGGLGVPTSAVGIIYGTVGVLALVFGGILGGWLISKYGFKKCLWPMVLALNVPDLFYLGLAYAQPVFSPVAVFGYSLPVDWLITSLVAVEQFGYGVGFTAFTMYLMLICQGKYKTANFAISTGIMALGMMVPGMISGYLQEAVGYPAFFLIVCLLTVPGMLVIFKIPMKGKAFTESSAGRK